MSLNQAIKLKYRLTYPERHYATYRAKRSTGLSPIYYQSKFPRLARIYRDCYRSIRTESTAEFAPWRRRPKEASRRVSRPLSPSARQQTPEELLIRYRNQLTAPHQPRPG